MPCRSREHSTIFFRLRAACRITRNVTTSYTDFLRIERLLHEAALRAEQDKPRARRGGKDAGSKNGAHTVHVVKRNIKGIVGGGVFTFDSHVGGYCFRQAEENQSVIDQMRRDVKQDSAARL